ncbi:MAG: thiamine-phosphate kinase [Gammaproteobacteria bacterium]|nr:thiamine-phosphate kinase [Gammaproteobacteria bacterium]MCF6231310.1 thiamine-phosphate kinase [Gammaproteobacteria bacterium]
MALAEFSLIEKYFSALGTARDDVLLGVGDDGAQLVVPADMSLVVAIDTMVEGVHFPVNTTAEDIGYKLLAVNLSDMAAMGAEPAWFTLALTLPESDEAWLAGFAKGIAMLANHHGVQLVGGDTTKGPRVLSLQAHGLVPAQQSLKRSGAEVGDGIYVTGTLGDAALGLRIALEGKHYSDSDYLLQRLNRPTPRVSLGMALRPIAHSAIDLSDGLLADLSHICKQSNVAAVLELNQLPLSPAYRATPATIDTALNGGDDYELCFTASRAAGESLKRLAQQHNCAISCIGEVVEGEGVSCYLDGKFYPTKKTGYQHFAG